MGTMDHCAILFLERYCRLDSQVQFSPRTQDFCACGWVRGWFSIIILLQQNITSQNLTSFYLFELMLLSTNDTIGIAY